MKIKGSYPLNVLPCKSVAGRKEWQRLPALVYQVAPSSGRRRQAVHNPIHSRYFICIMDCFKILPYRQQRNGGSWGKLPIVNYLQMPLYASSATHCQMLMAFITWAMDKIGQPKIIGTSTERKSFGCPKIQKRTIWGEKTKKYIQILSLVSVTFPCTCLKEEKVM